MAVIKARKKKTTVKRASKVLTPAGHPKTPAQWKRLQQMVDANYPKGRFVGIENGKVLADGATFREVDDALNAMGKTSRNIIVLQSGDDTPDFVYFLL